MVGVKLADGGDRSGALTARWQSCRVRDRRRNRDSDSESVALRRSRWNVVAPTSTLGFSLVTFRFTCSFSRGSKSAVNGGVTRWWIRRTIVYTYTSDRGNAVSISGYAESVFIRGKKKRSIESSNVWWTRRIIVFSLVRWWSSGEIPGDGAIHTRLNVPVLLFFFFPAPRRPSSSVTRKKKNGETGCRITFQNRLLVHRGKWCCDRVTMSA